MDLKKITDQVAALSMSVGQFIQGEAAGFSSASIEHKGLNDLVSYVDREAEKLLVTGLADILPEAGFITEEGTVETERKEVSWVVDPLDGTTNFIHGLPVYAISIGLLQGDKIVAGVVNELNRGECFSAWKGGGAWCNGRQIKVSMVEKLSDSLIATGFPYHDFDRMDDYLAILHEFMKGSHGVRRLGSAAVDLAYVACGRFEGFFEYNLKPWDVAGGIIIVQEAGGTVSDFSGGEDFLFGRQIVAGCRAHVEMKALIGRHW